MRNRKTIFKIVILGIFITGSILIGFLWFLNPLIPTKWNGDPYSVSIYQLYKGANVVENEQVVITENIDNFNFNGSSDILTIIISDTIHNIQITFQFNNWSTHEKYNITVINIGISYSIKGKSLLISEGIVLGLDIMEIQSNRTYILSLLGLVVIIPLIFYYFKIDYKKLKLIRKNKKKSKGGS